MQASTSGLQAQLRTSVTAYVQRLHTDGMSPEQTVVQVKRTVQEATSAELDPAEARALMEDVVRWTVDAYYRTSAAD